MAEIYAGLNPPPHPVRPFESRSFENFPEVPLHQPFESVFPLPESGPPQPDMARWAAARAQEWSHEWSHPQPQCGAPPAYPPPHNAYPPPLGGMGEGPAIYPEGPPIYPEGPPIYPEPLHGGDGVQPSGGGIVRVRPGQVPGAFIVDGVD